MTVEELKSYTVLELRKLAKENNIVLGTGLPKQEIIFKISSVLCPSEMTEETITPAVPVSQSPTASEVPVERPAPRYSSTPAYQAPVSYQSRPAWQSPSSAAGRSQDSLQWQPPARPTGYVPRFGPAASQPRVQPQSPSQMISNTPVRDEDHMSVQAPVVPVVSPLPEKRYGAGGFGPGTRQTPVESTPKATGFGPGSFSRVPAYSAPQPSMNAPQSPRPVYGSQQEGVYLPPQPQDLGITPPTLEELLASGDYVDGEGILELHPDGYGFLRSAAFLPSSKDIYVSMAQVRRFTLRSGDMVTGKVRPQREGDRYSAMLYITTVNGVSVDEMEPRQSFDELTPMYPTRRMDLQPKNRKENRAVRFIDLIAPIGFGQRGLLLCPPDTGKRELIRDMANTLCENYPDVHVMSLFIDMTPEDVTLIREQMNCQVLASTFDQSPENHLRLADLVLEHAMRLVEQKQDVVIFADSLTRLAKIYSTAAAQQGRSLPGMVNPTSLFKAKHLFGAARCVKEGGSLTIIAAMDIQTGSKVDDSVVEEFKGTANMELTLDATVARAGIVPALNLQQSFTKNADILLDEAHLEGLRSVRSMIGTTRSVMAIPQLMSMMDKVDTNADLLLKMTEWFALMNRK